MGSQPKWLAGSWARRKLWALVVSKFTNGAVVGPHSITITRDELVECGVFGGFDAAGNPKPPRVGAAPKGEDSDG